MSAQANALMSIFGMTPEEPTNIVYSTDQCPKCQQLKAFLSSRCIPFQAKDVSDTDAATRTDMILDKGYFPLMVPILQTSGTWLYVDEIFENDKLNEARLEVACQK